MVVRFLDVSSQIVVVHMGTFHVPPKSSAAYSAGSPLPAGVGLFAVVKFASFVRLCLVIVRDRLIVFALNMLEILMLCVCGSEVCGDVHSIWLLIWC